jgi:hypothetical protein
MLDIEQYIIQHTTPTNLRERELILALSYSEL